MNPDMNPVFARQNRAFDLEQDLRSRIRLVLVPIRAVVLEAASMFGAAWEMFRR